MQFDALLVVLDEHFDGDPDPRHAVGLGGPPLELRHGLTDGLALFPGEERAEFVLAFAQDDGIPSDEFRALFAGSLTPVSQRAPGGRHRSLQVSTAGRGADGENLFRRRIDHLHDLSAGNRFTVDGQRKIVQ